MMDIAKDEAISYFSEKLDKAKCNLKMAEVRNCGGNVDSIANRYQLFS